MARNPAPSQPVRSAPARGFTLIEVLVAISILGILMAAVMTAFQGTTKVVSEMQERSEVMQNLRGTGDQLQRDLSQAIINNNRPDGEQVYFEIQQVGDSDEQSVLRFGSTTERGLIEVGYQICVSTNGWQHYRLRRMHRTDNKNLWKYTREKDWPELDFNSKDVEPFARNLVGFKVEYWSPRKGQWILGNWDSLQLNAMPPRLRITVTAVTRSRAKEMTALKVEKIADVKRNELEVHVIEVTLPQAQR